MSSPPTDIQTKLSYLSWQDTYTHTRPYRIIQFGRRKKNNEENESHNLVFRKGDKKEIIRDIRGIDEKDVKCKFTLETTGFVYCKHPPSASAAMTVQDFWDPGKVERVFFPECEAVLRREIEGVRKVVIMDWKVRKKKSAKDRRTWNKHLQSPAPLVHMDTILTVDKPGTPMMERIRNHLPAEDQHLLSGRVQLINFWRPINGPVEDRPMAVCDGRTFDPSNFVESDMTNRNYTGTIPYLLYDATRQLRWYYMSKQSNEDVILFKSFDSKEGSVKYVPHAAFKLPKIAEGVRPRVSIEARALVFTA